MVHTPRYLPADAPVGALAPDLADPEPAGELTVAALQEHACKIFVSDAGEPVASHGPPLATESTSLLVKLALAAIRSDPGQNMSTWSHATSTTLATTATTSTGTLQ